jgi:hypothetical protein
MGRHTIVLGVKSLAVAATAVVSCRAEITGLKVEQQVLSFQYLNFSIDTGCKPGVL